MLNVIAGIGSRPHKVVHHFDIAPNRCGLWRVTARDGLIGGTFRTEKDAVRFALDEADGDRNCVHKLYPGAG